jgi:hypothetical protein
LVSSKNVGTAGTGVTAVETSNGTYHETILSFTALDLINPAGAANLAGGALIYTFPSGDVTILGSTISLMVDEASGATNTADTPDLGLGTVIASGAVATLDGTATFENIMTGQTMNDVNGTYENASVTTILKIASASAHTVHLNIADGWAGDGAMVQATGFVYLRWVYGF